MSLITFWPQLAPDDSRMRAESSRTPLKSVPGQQDFRVLPSGLGCEKPASAWSRSVLVSRDRGAGLCRVGIYMDQTESRQTGRQTDSSWIEESSEGVLLKPRLCFRADGRRVPQSDGLDRTGIRCERSCLPSLAAAVMSSADGNVGGSCADSTRRVIRSVKLSPAPVRDWTV